MKTLKSMWDWLCGFFYVSEEEYTELTSEYIECSIYKEKR